MVSTFFCLEPKVRVSFLHMGRVQGLNVVLLPREGVCGQPRCAVKVNEVGLTAVRVKHE